VAPRNRDKISAIKNDWTRNSFFTESRSAVMITLSVLLLLIFVPASRRLFIGLVNGVFALLGIAFLITKDSNRRRRGF
jgi:hypothetical protein